MASVHQRPGSQYWHAAFRGPDGRLILRSTKQTEREAALSVALEYQRAAKLAQRGELVETQAREVLNDIMKRANIGEFIQTVSIKDHCERWLAGKKTRKAANTAERYKGVIDYFVKLLDERANKPLTTLTARDVDRFLDARLKEGVAPRTAVLGVKIIRACLNQARRHGLIPINPAEAVELPDVEGVERGTFTPAEVKMLVDAVDAIDPKQKEWKNFAGRKEWKTLIMLAYFTGARLGDCCRMQWEDVDLGAETLSYTQAKTGAKITVPLHPDLLAHLETLAGTDKAERFLAPHMANLKPGGRHGLSEGFKRIVRKAGLDLQTVQGAGVRQISRRTFHALRHSFTSALANKNVAPELRMKLTGHKTEAVHRGYTHHELETLRKAVAKMPGLKGTK